VWREIYNNVVQTEAEEYGRKTRYSLLHPEKNLFFDEVGENISQKGDGNAGGQKFMVARDIRAQVMNSLKYNHFTVLGFTAADGRAVMCAIIIAAIQVESHRCDRFQPSIEGCRGYEQQRNEGVRSRDRENQR
jgi:hypothetical protein